MVRFTVKMCKQLENDVLLSNEAVEKLIGQTSRDGFFIHNAWVEDGWVLLDMEGEIPDGSEFVPLNLLAFRLG